MVTEHGHWDPVSLAPGPGVTTRQERRPELPRHGLAVELPVITPGYAPELGPARLRRSSRLIGTPGSNDGVIVGVNHGACRHHAELP